MRKIFGYECKRLMWNKFSAGLALVLLFYGWQEGDEGVYHAFKMEDPAGEADDEEIAKELADMLDTEPMADDFNFTDMYVSLPQSLVDRIKADGVKEYLEQGQ